MPRMTAVAGLAASLVLGGPAFGASLDGGARSRPEGTAAPPVLVAANNIFKLRSPYSHPVKVKIHGNFIGFPVVVLAPASPAPGIPIPYPNLSMWVQMEKPGGGWTKKKKISWKSGNITLPKF